MFFSSDLKRTEFLRLVQKMNCLLRRKLRFFAACSLGFFGFCLISFRQTIFKNVLILRPGSLLYKYWETPPVDLPTDFYFFNWTNSADIYNLSVKPKFEELGPYRFWQRERKVNVKWNGNGTVTYQQEKFWFYDNSQENGNLKDPITTVDPLTMGASYQLRNWNYYIRKIIFFTLRSLAISKTQQVGEFLFDGYKEPLLKVAAALPVFKHLNLPHWDRFGWLYQRNGSTENDGTFNMGTGTNSTLGSIYFWNYNNKSPYYQSACVGIYGSGGQLFAQNLQKDFVSLYLHDLQRTVNLTFEKEEMVGSILGYKYRADKNLWDNGTLFPDNFCFCNGDCVPSGMLNLSLSRHGSPSFASLPHFYNADPYYINLVDGLKIDPEKHELYMVIEPSTGIPLKVDAKLQLNILLQPIPGIAMLEKIPTIFIPMLWTRQTFEINNFHSILITLLVNQSVITIFVGTLIILISLGILICEYRKNPQVTTQQDNNLEDQKVPLQISLPLNL